MPLAKNDSHEKERMIFFDCLTKVRRKVWLKIFSPAK